VTFVLLMTVVFGLCAVAGYLYARADYRGIAGEE